MADFNFFLNRQGVRGNKGEQGEQGYSPRITVKTETAAEYVLNVQNEDGSFDTPNLRGNAIENLGGTYIRFNQDTEQMYTGYADTASTTSQGEVTLSTYEDLKSGGDESEVTTSRDVHDFVEAKISEASVNYVDIDDYTQKMGELDSEISDLDENKLDFTGLTNTLAAGTNITITPNVQTGKITIAGEPVSQAQADWNQTDINAPDYIKNKPVIDDELSSTSTNAVQNRLVTNAINLISNEFENYATNKLDNLSNEGEARLHALKAYSDNGEVLTDSKGLQDVIKYAHSTFDLSKFTVVGSPTITDDGVASGFSGSNGLTAIEIDVTKPFKLFCENTTGNSLGTSFVVGFNSDWKNFIVYDSDAIRFWGSFTDGTTTTNFDLKINKTLQLNTKYFFEFSWDGTRYKMTVYNSDMSIFGTSQYDSTLHISGNNKVLVGLGKQTRYCNLGSIDLKQFSITVGGVEVFSGNKTGIDTIKPDDYTVVGTPTISDDGILQSPLSSSNHIETGFSYDISKDFEYSFSAYITYQSGLGDKYLSGLRTNKSMATLRFNGSKIYCVFNNADGILYASYTQTGWYDFIISKKGTTYTWKYKLSTDAVYTTKTATLTETYTSSNEELCIGYVGSDYMNYAKIDLNTFKFYNVDGNLVYQPCLKIPYTQSKTGSKIVNAVYRDRVNDMAEQFGSANYYTLDEDNGTFTLPQVELYGLIEKAASTVPSGVVQSSTIRNIVSLTQAEYDALVTKDANTFYVITPST